MAHSLDSWLTTVSVAFSCLAIPMASEHVHVSTHSPPSPTSIWASGHVLIHYPHIIVSKVVNYFTNRKTGSLRHEVTTTQPVGCRGFKPRAQAACVLNLVYICGCGPTGIDVCQQSPPNQFILAIYLQHSRTSDVAEARV